ncbi:MAG: NAD(P)-dependent oxidoreductase [Spirochaetes bacterium]|nr:NAD(P)-dependent oxidoreductase [Spirochaetota bacterium]
MKTVVVTGCSGYLGQHVVQTLLREKYAVTGVDIKESPAEGQSNFTFVKGDIVDSELVMKACNNATAIIHCAAALAQFVKDAQRMYDINVVGTRNIVEVCKKRAIKQLVFISSVEVYGIDVPVPCPEDALLNPVCPYGVHKVIGEHMCMELADKGHGVAILRPPTINGPGQNEPFLVAQMEAVYKGKPVILPGGGKTKLQMVDVRDVAQAVLLSLKKINRGLLIANIASDNVPTLHQLVSALFTHAGKKEKIISVPAALARALVKGLSRIKLSPLEPQHLEIALRDYVFDNTRAKKVLGWKPTKNDIESAIDAYEWFVNSSRKEIN